MGPRSGRYFLGTGLLAICCALLSGVILGEDLAASISLKDLQRARWSGPLAKNGAFMPGVNATTAHESFEGILSFAESRMTTVPAAFKSKMILGRDPQLFPSFKLAFFTQGGDLVPVNQELIPAASAGRGHSYWDVIVQPGAVWSTPADDGWSRAGFPFALVNSLEGETHNGVATFAYRRGKISNLRMQIVQQTSPFYVVDYFTATGLIPVRWSAPTSGQYDIPRRRYQMASRDQLVIAPWADLQARFPNGQLNGFDDSIAPSNLVVSALDYDGTVYMKPCDTVAGPLPWCDRARFGVWSATKSLVNETALLRLAQKYGPEVFAQRIADFIPQAAAFPAWEKVRFIDAANMATGVGNGSLKRDPNDILDGAIEKYAAWYEARSEQDKIREALAGAKPFPWGPGKVARYRDQDMFMLGVALDNYVKKKEGATAGVLALLLKEVFEPIGIHEAPIGRTLEGARREGQPLMAFGFYPTVSDIVRIARLYQNFGAYQGNQLLYRPKIEELVARTSDPGLPTGHPGPAGESSYFNAFWRTSYLTPQGCKLYYPQMEGWGGTAIALFPNRLTGIRIAKIWADDGGVTGSTAGMAGVANNLRAICGTVAGHPTG
jgi:Beta-lactamase